MLMFLGWWLTLNKIHIWSKTVGATLEKLLDVNPKRKAVYILNNGSVDVRVYESETASSFTLIPVGTQGELDAYNCQDELWVKVGTGTCDCKITEVLGL